MNAQPVDHDLLAGYVGGALDGSPDGADVAELVATDPEWADAHDRLVVALEAVGADLAAYAAVDEPMPDDVAARLEAALADAPPALTVVSGGRPGAGRRKRKIPGWLAPVAVAASVVAFAGFWLNSAGGGFSADDSGGSDSAATSSDAGGSGNAEQAPAAASAPVLRREATGLDYDDQMVESGVRTTLRSSDAPQGPPVRRSRQVGLSSRGSGRRFRGLGSAGSADRGIGVGRVPRRDRQRARRPDRDDDGRRLRPI